MRCHGYTIISDKSFADISKTARAAVAHAKKIIQNFDFFNILKNYRNPR